MAIYSISIHPENSISLESKYLGDHDTAILRLVDNKYKHKEYATIFFDGVYSDRLREAVEAFNAVMQRPEWQEEYAEPQDYVAAE